LQTLRADELTHILERVVEIGLRGGWKDVDIRLPCPVRGDSSSSEAKSISRADSSMPEVGILGSLPDLSEKFKDPGRSVETLDRKEIADGKRT